MSTHFDDFGSLGGDSLIDLKLEFETSAFRGVFW